MHRRAGMAIVIAVAIGGCHRAAHDVSVDAGVTVDAGTPVPSCTLGPVLQFPDPGVVGFVVADVDGDHRPDLVTLHPRANTLEVWLADGAGGLRAPTTIETPSGPYEVVAADFDGDGHVDLATVGTALDIFDGHGDGTFTHAASLPAGVSPGVLAVGDFDHDGAPDLVVADANVITDGSAYESNLTVLRNDGSGGFSPTATLVSDAEAFAIAVGDLDGNGTLDIVDVTVFGGTVCTHLNHGDGTFADRWCTPAGGNFNSLVVADLDGDGTLDVDVGGQLFHGNGDGTLGAGTNGVGGDGAGAIAAADLDGNGVPDLIVADSDGSVSVMLGTGSGVFAAPREFPAGFSGPTQIVAADLTGDGRLDLVVCDNSEVGFTITPGAGDGTFGAPLYPFAVGPNDAVLADADGDGTLDVVVSDVVFTSFGDPIVPAILPIFFGDGSGAFTAASIPIDPITAGTAEVAVADFNGDRIPDLIVSSSQNDTDLIVLPGQGGRAFAVSPLRTVLTNANHFVVADLDGDGRQDLIGAAYPDQLVIAFGNGDGTFGSMVTYPLDLVASTIAIGDLDHDGVLDVVAAGSDAQTGAGIAVLHGTGNRALGLAVVYPVALAPTAIALAPLSDDQTLDLATLNPDGTIGVLRGDTDGTFVRAEVTYQVAAGASTFGIGHVSGGVRPDIVVGAQGIANDGGTYAISALQNRGDGTFFPAVSYSISGAPVRILVGDVRNSGHDSIVIVAGTDVGEDGAMAGTVEVLDERCTSP